MPVALRSLPLCSPPPYARAGPVGAVYLARLSLRRGPHCTDRCTHRRYTRRDRRRHELFDLLLALSAKRAGGINFAPFATALLSLADVTVELFLNDGDAHAEMAEHTPGTRTRITRQRGEEVLGVDVATPGLLCNRGRTLHRLTGLGRLLWRPLAGPTSFSWEQLSRGGAYRLGPHSQLLQNGGGYPLMEKPDQLVMGAHLGGPVSGGLPPGCLQAAPGRCAQLASSRRSARAAAGPQSAAWPPAWIPLSAGRSRSRNTPPGAPPPRTGRSARRRARPALR